MSEKVKSQMISRREAFSLLGLAAALGFALPAEVLTASDAEAQQQTTAPARRPEGRLACSGVTRDALVAMSGVRRGGPVATSGVRNGAEVAKPHQNSNQDLTWGAHRKQRSLPFICSRITFRRSATAPAAWRYSPRSVSPRPAVSNFAADLRPGSSSK